MDQGKFSRMMMDFPFIKKIVKDIKWGKNFVKVLKGIETRKADERLLKAEPINLIGGSHGKCWLLWDRYFWIVSGVEVFRLKEKVNKYIPAEDKIVQGFADPISGQLIGFLDKDISHI